METLRIIAFLACFLSVAISMLDIIRPDGKFKKQVRLIFSLVFLISIITPIMHNDINLDVLESEDIKQTSEYRAVCDTFYNSLSDNYSDNLEKALCAKLQINNVNPKEISVIVNIDENNCINIIEVQIVLAVQDKNNENKSVKIIQNEIGNYPVKITYVEEENE